MHTKFFSNACLANFACSSKDGRFNADSLVAILKERHGHDAEFWVEQTDGVWSVRATAKAVSWREAIATSLEMLQEFSAGFYHARR